MTTAPDSLTTLHEALLSERAAGIKQSAVRDVFELSLDPSLVSLAGGNPFLSRSRWKRSVRLLGASSSSGVPKRCSTALALALLSCRQQIIDVMAAEGITNVKVEDVVVTNGSQSAQDMACKVFCDPGDTVLCEDPTYVGVLNTFEAYQVKARPVGTDGNGLIPSALRERIAKLRVAG